MDALTGEDVFKVIRHLLHVLVCVHANYEVKVGIDELLPLAGYHLLHLLDVLHGHLVRGVWNARMTILLLVKHRQLTLLVGKEHHLVIHHRIHIWDMVYLTHEVNRHHGIVDRHVNVWAQYARQTHRVHIQETVDLALAAAHVDLLTVDLEIGHREVGITEVQRKEAVGILTGFLHRQELRCLDTAVMQLVCHLVDLHQEVTPLAAVIAQQGTLPGLLRDNQIGAGCRILPPVEEAEIGIGKETAFRTRRQGLAVEALPDKHVLLVQGVALTQRLDHCRHQVRKVIITVSISRILLYRVLHLQDGRILAGLGIEYPYPVRILDTEIDVLEGIGTLAARAKGPDRQPHTHKDT